MQALTLTLAAENDLIVIPGELARRAGLTAGSVHVVLGHQSLTLIAEAPKIDYTIQAHSLAATLREQAAEFASPAEEEPDAEYWEIVEPLFADAERMIGVV